MYREVTISAYITGLDVFFFSNNVLNSFSFICVAVLSLTRAKRKRANKRQDKQRQK